MKINIINIFVLLLMTQTGLAQVVKGLVKDVKGEPIIGAYVYWMDKSAEAITDDKGTFALPIRSKERMIHVEFVGYEMNMVTLQPNQTEVTITLEEPKQLQAVQVTGRRGDNTVSALDPHNVERISSNELKKAPCCNLSESFETNGTVDIQYTDAITGAKEIQMLGLRGIYTQLMVENRPDFYGLAMPYALEYLPSTWLKSIDINKGVGSVKNGMQSITGQINTVLVEPSEDAPVFLNLFTENTGRAEANVHLNQVVNKHYAHQVLLHASALQNKIDRDQDAFLDLPLRRQYNGMYRGFYADKNVEGQLFVHALTERRQSGQLSEQNPVRNPFLIDVENKRVSVTGKLGYLGFKKPYNSIGSQWSATYHDAHALYGRNRYKGEQRSFYANLIYATIISTTDNKLNIGGSVQYDDYQEYLNDRDLSRTDILTGAFGEYTYSRPVLGKGYNDITFIAGLRADYHQQFKTFVSPRLNFKYNFNEGDVMRVSAGRGVRVANPIAENIAFLATNRAIIIGNDLKPEDAWNFGLNAVKSFKVANREWRWSADVYRTQFVNQIVTDIESDYKTAQFYNLDGKSYSNVFLTMLNAAILRGLDVKLSYKFNDVKTTYQNRLAEVPLVSRHRALASIDYRTPNKKWLFNWTTQLVGQQRLADRTYVPLQYHHEHDGLSPTYSISHFSVNYLLKKVEVYGGAENLFNYTQHSPIIAWQDPTSEYFDATQVYAPMMGRRLYIGLRWRMGEQK